MAYVGNWQIRINFTQMNQYSAQIFVYAQHRLLAFKGLKIHSEIDAFIYLFIIYLILTFVTHLNEL